MALLWMEGFEGLGTTEGPSERANVTARLRNEYEADYVAESGSPFLRSGEVVGKSMSFGQDISADGTTLTWNFPRDVLGETIVVGWRFRTRNHTGGPTTHNLLQVSSYLAGTNGRHLLLTIDYSTGELKIYRGTTLLETSSFSLIANSTWHSIEVKFNIDNSTGSYDVLLNDVSVLSASGIDTKENGINKETVNTLQWAGAEALNNDLAAEEFLMDDLYVLDTVGSNNTDFLGSASRVVMLSANVDGTTNDFTPQTGINNFAMVDDDPASDTDYNDGSTNGDIDEYGFTNVSEPMILGVMLQTYSKPATNGTRTYRHRVRSGATVGNGIDIGVADDQTDRTLFEVDPNTSALWTKTNLNSAEFGVEVRN